VHIKRIVPDATNLEPVPVCDEGFTTTVVTVLPLSY